MSVPRFRIIQRGLAHRCPNCGERALFRPRSLRVNERCPSCGTLFERGEGFFLGPWVLNYTVAVFLFVLPAIIAGVRGVIPWSLCLVLSALGCTLVPVLLYRSSWSWWLMLYFYFLPERLPANGGATSSEED